MTVKACSMWAGLTWQLFCSHICYCFICFGFAYCFLPRKEIYPFGIIWTATSEFGTYSLCEQRRFRRACASAQSRQNLRCSLIQAVSQEEHSDRKPDPWPLWMAGHAQLKFVMTKCSKTQIRLTGPICKPWMETHMIHAHMHKTSLLSFCILIFQTSLYPYLDQHFSLGVSGLCTTGYSFVSTTLLVWLKS